jgi:hypothetical protein
MDKVTKIELPAGRYTLSRERDGVGDSGIMIESFDRKNPTADHEQRVLEIGKAVRCGSHYARSYSAQDWWLTTAIEEFLEVSEDKTMIRFRTENGSIYTLTVS